MEGIDKIDALVVLFIAIHGFLQLICAVEYRTAGTGGKPRCLEQQTKRDIGPFANGTPAGSVALLKLAPPQLQTGVMRGARGEAREQELI
jgi:hypothetical protein